MVCFFIAQNYNEKAIPSRHRADLLADNAIITPIVFPFSKIFFLFCLIIFPIL